MIHSSQPLDFWEVRGKAALTLKKKKKKRLYEIQSVVRNVFGLGVGVKEGKVSLRISYPETQTLHFRVPFTEWGTRRHFRRSHNHLLHQSELPGLPALELFGEEPAATCCSTKLLSLASL